MRVFVAVMLDSLRLLKARKMFGISLGISLMIALSYAAIGFNEKGITFFGVMEFGHPMVRGGSEHAAAFYILMFTDLIVRYWLAWVVILIGLISTISIFPDFLAEGGIEVTLSKPVSRATLFLLKYLGALLFVAIQVGLLSLIAFLAIGWRVGEWNPGVFWAVPVVTFVFSLIYCVSVLAAVRTKSTAFSLIAGLGIWGTALLVQWGEDLCYKMGVMLPQLGVRMDLRTGEPRLTDDKEGGKIAEWQKIFESAMAPLPKTRECTLYLKRLIVFEDRNSPIAGTDLSMVLTPGASDPRMKKAMEAYERRHSAWYVFGTSALFEVIVLGGAMWIFCRRDF